MRPNYSSKTSARTSVKASNNKLTSYEGTVIETSPKGVVFQFEIDGKTIQGTYLCSNPAEFKKQQKTKIYIFKKYGNNCIVRLIDNPVAQFVSKKENGKSFFGEIISISGPTMTVQLAKGVLAKTKTVKKGCSIGKSIRCKLKGYDALNQTVSVIAFSA